MNPTSASTFIEKKKDKIDLLTTCIDNTITVLNTKVRYQETAAFNNITCKDFLPLQIKNCIN